MKKQLFGEFESKGKREWLSKVEQDLKGKPLEQLNWKLENGLTFSPFAHREDLVVLYDPLTTGQSSNAWEIGFYIKVTDFQQANKEALQALENGANALGFHLEKTPNRAELTTLLRDLQLEWISTNFTIQQPSWERITSNFLKIIEEKGQNPSLINCSFAFEGNEIVDLEQFEQTIDSIPKSKLLTINAQPFFNGKEGIIEELTQTIIAANDLLIQLNHKGLDLEKVHSSIQFSLISGDSYFLNIAKIRALKLLWQQVLSAWDQNFKMQSPIEIHLTKATQTENENFNKIKATTQAMSAVIGGANRLFIHASDEFKDERGSDFSQRIALNIQHLLQLESYFDKVIDPAAGSYYIEKMTDDLTEMVWEGVQKRI